MSIDYITHRGLDYHETQQMLLTVTQRLAKIRAYPLLCWGYLLAGITLLLTAGLRQCALCELPVGGRDLAQALILGLVINGLLLGFSGVLMLLKHRRARFAATTSLILLLAFCGVFLLLIFYVWIFVQTSTATIATPPWNGDLMNNLHDLGSKCGIAFLLIPLLPLVILYIGFSVRLCRSVRSLFRSRKRVHAQLERETIRMAS